MLIIREELLFYSSKHSQNHKQVRTSVRSRFDFFVKILKKLKTLIFVGFL